MMSSSAGVIIGVSYPVLDELLVQQHQGQQAASVRVQGEGLMAAPSTPSWPTVILAITLFVLQYRLSGFLEVPLLGEPDILLPQNNLVAPFCDCTVLIGSEIRSDGECTWVSVGHHGLTDAILLAYGLVVWRCLDGTPQGLAMSCLTAVAGPAVEVLLINILGLYAYTHPQVERRAGF